jgi:uncharacterized protein YpmB
VCIKKNEKVEEILKIVLGIKMGHSAWLIARLPKYSHETRVLP